MKYKYLLPLVFLCTLKNVNAQGAWTQLSNFGAGNREISFWFTINNIGFVGGGRDNLVAFDDLWQYDATTDSWNQKATKPGGGVFSPGTFVIGDTAYIVSGWNGSLSAYQTVWAYVSSINTWIQKNNFPGPARYSCMGFSVNGKGYFGTGYGPLMNDFWEYNPTSDSWIQKPNCPGNARQHATALTVAGKGYFGMGYSGTSFNDWWEYDAVLGTWTAKAQFPGGARRGAMYFEMNGKAYVAAGYNNITYYNDLWEYNPVNDTWTQLLPDMPAPGRYAGFGFGFNGCAYIGTGSNGGIGVPNELNDVWKYCLNTGVIESSNQNAITISPNPTTSNPEINFSENFFSPIQFELYSTEGKKVFTKQITANQKKVKLDLQKLSDGVYFYSLKNSERKMQNGKLVIAK